MSERDLSENAHKLFASLTSKAAESKPLKAIIKGNQALNEFQLPHFNTPGRQVPDQQADLHKEIEQLKHELKIARNNVTAAEKAAAHRVETETQRAWAQGREAGFAEAYDQAQKELAEKIASFAADVSATLDSISAAYNTRCAEIEAQTVELSIGLAQRLFCTLKSSDQEIISNVIREAMSFLGQEEELTIIVNPHDQQWAQESQNFWLPLGSAVRRIEINADDRVQQGGCIIESGKGARIELGVESILAKFENAVRSHYQLYQSQNHESQ